MLELRLMDIWLTEGGRLYSGDTCQRLVLACVITAEGTEWTEDVDKSWLATVCQSDKQTVNQDLKYLESSGMAEILDSEETVRVRLLFDEWPKLPDYRKA
jgi:hypothetical protein